MERQLLPAARELLASPCRLPPCLGVPLLCSASPSAALRAQSWHGLSERLRGLPEPCLPGPRALAAPCLPGPRALAAPCLPWLCKPRFLGALVAFCISCEALPAGRASPSAKAQLVGGVLRWKALLLGAGKALPGKRFAEQLEPAAKPQVARAIG